MKERFIIVVVIDLAPSNAAMMKHFDSPWKTRAQDGYRARGLVSSSHPWSVFPLFGPLDRGGSACAFIGHDAARGTPAS